MSAKPPLQDFKEVIRKALFGLNIEKAREHSRMDHHVKGLNYLNLQRSDSFTLKLYLIEEQANNNSGYLVHPHNHRYEFNTVVLAGRISNVIFDDVGAKPVKDERRMFEDDISGGGDFAARRFVFDAETKQLSSAQDTWLDIDSGLSAGHGAGGSYFTKTNQIHTLFTWPEPTLLCLSQYQDMQGSSVIYLPVGMDENSLEITSRLPTLEEMEAMRLRCLELIS